MAIGVVLGAPPWVCQRSSLFHHVFLCILRLQSFQPTGNTHLGIFKVLHIHVSFLYNKADLLYPLLFSDRICSLYSSYTDH
ncbi:hypothetical protein GDO78_010079 [Eleutherodactylus coqui]|uniref:Uncharacterized protein n=1 Tax=Eleutherodactylus coqui TaxID=57060 RepID=A0A8J6F9X5_ELECQ|nr:hypothetical protein GDO78_010079 [Eleutherodactylus coqui]